MRRIVILSLTLIVLLSCNPENESVDNAKKQDDFVARITNATEYMVNKKDSLLYEYERYINAGDTSKALECLYVYDWLLNEYVFGTYVATIDIYAKEIQGLDSIMGCNLQYMKYKTQKDSAMLENLTMLESFYAMTYMYYGIEASDSLFNVPLPSKCAIHPIVLWKDVMKKDILPIIFDK